METNGVTYKVEKHTLVVTEIGMGVTRRGEGPIRPGPKRNVESWTVIVCVISPTTVTRKRVLRVSQNLRGELK